MSNNLQTRILKGTDTAKAFKAFANCIVNVHYNDYRRLDGTLLANTYGRYGIAALVVGLCGKENLNLTLGNLANNEITTDTERFILEMWIDRRLAFGNIIWC